MIKHGPEHGGERFSSSEVTQKVFFFCFFFLQQFHSFTLQNKVSVCFSPLTMDCATFNVRQKTFGSLWVFRFQIHWGRLERSTCRYLELECSSNISSYKEWLCYTPGIFLLRPPLTAHGRRFCFPVWFSNREHENQIFFILTVKLKNILWLTMACGIIVTDSQSRSLIGCFRL